MGPWLWGYGVNVLFVIVVGIGAQWWFGRRRRRLERQHEVRLRLVDLSGQEFMNVTCRELAMIRRYGGQDDPPWMTIEVFGNGRNYPVRLQVAPAHLD